MENEKIIVASDSTTDLSPELIEKYNIKIIPMKLVEEEKEYRRYTYKAKVSLASGGNYGYTFRVMPTNEMLLDSENLDLVKWITK